MTTIAEREALVHEVAAVVAREAREHGHDMHAWAPQEYGVGVFSACRRCGGPLHVVYETHDADCSVEGVNLSRCTSAGYINEGDRHATDRA